MYPAATEISVYCLRLAVSLCMWQACVHLLAKKAIGQNYFQQHDPSEPIGLCWWIQFGSDRATVTWRSMCCCPSNQLVKKLIKLGMLCTDISCNALLMLCFFLYCTVQYCNIFAMYSVQITAKIALKIHSPIKLQIASYLEKLRDCL